MVASIDTKISRLGPDERRRQLLLFGQVFFAENRFDSLTMKELALRAGVSKGLLYHYFGDRRGYYLATMKFTMDEIVDVFSASSDRGVLSLREMLVDLTNYFTKTRHFYLMSTQSGDPDIRKEISRVQTVMLDTALELRGLKYDSPLADLTMRGWLAFCESAISDWLRSNLITQTELVDLLIYQFESATNMFNQREDGTLT
ncbi:MAG: AcrR family transcriptional regulator [Porticoccus sp.]|jgi:AcrR family transcriptional regulator